MFVMREKPEKPPSAVSEVPVKRLTCKLMFKAFKDKPNFIMLIVTFALPFGSVNAVGTLISNIYDPFGYSPTDLAVITLELCIFGVISTICMGRWIDKTGSYKKTMIVWNIL